MIKTALHTLRFDIGFSESINHLIRNLFTPNIRIFLLIEVIRKTIKARIIKSASHISKSYQKKQKKPLPETLEHSI